MLTKLASALRAFRGNREGVGAVEFAIVAPVLIVLYIGSLEVSVALSANKKIARASSTVADLVTQHDGDVNKAFLATMVDVSESVISPFKTTGLSVKITGINLDSTGKATVVWSWKNGGGVPYAKNSEIAVPSQLQIPSTFLVRSEVQMDYDLLLALPGVSAIENRHLTLGKTYHMRERLGGSVSCTDCGG